MKENEIYLAITRGAAKDGWLLIKIVDGSVGKKPFDMFGFTHQNIPVAIEVKIYRGKSRLCTLPENQFESQQLTYLMEWVKRGAMSLALIYEMNTKTLHVYNFREQSYIGFLHLQNDLWRGWKEI